MASSRFPTIALSSLALVVSLTTAAPAQEGRPPHVEFEHDGRAVTGFALYAVPEGGKEIRVEMGMISPDRRGVRTAAIPPLPDGTYTIAVSAYGAKGESARVSALPGKVTVKGGVQSVALPNAPAPKLQDAPNTKAVDQEPAAPKPKGGGVFGRIWKGVVGGDDPP